MPIDLDEYEVDEDMTAKEKKKLMRNLALVKKEMTND